MQYNRLPGRGRDFLESHGLLWFFSYKLRIMKIAAKMLRDRPVSSLFVMGGMGPSLGIDSVASGSIAGTTWDGSVGYAIGPEMGMKQTADFRGQALGCIKQKGGVWEKVRI